MKKILASALALTMALSLTACGGGGSNNAGSSNSSANNSSAPASSNSSTSTPASSSGSAPAAPADSGSDIPNAADLVSPNLIDPQKDWGQYDSLIAQIKSETDFAKRAELMHEAEDILMANYCVIPIYYYNDIYMQKDYVDGIYSNLYGFKYFMYSTLSNGSDTLRINLSSEPAFLDPALNSSVDGACLAVNSFSGLYSYDDKGQTIPDCAESYEMSGDGMTYTVKLRDGLKWSDGSDLTADDFVYAWKRVADPNTGADYGYMFSGFKGYPDDLAISAPDATTLVFELDAPCAYMEDLMAFPAFYPVKQSAVESYSGWQTSPGGWCTEAGFVSNGAYVCTAWNHDTSMTYEKNPYWRDADNVKVEKLEFMLSADDTAIYAAYNAGDLDFADSIPTDEIATLLAEENPEFYIVDNLGTYYAAFNCKSKLFEGKTVEQAAAMREAFSLLIDRDYICENIGQTGQVAANAFIPLGMADGNGGVFKSSAEDQRRLRRHPGPGHHPAQERRL